MIKQILCCALLVGQLFAGERMSFNLPEGVDSGSTHADFVSKFPGLEGIFKDLMPVATEVVDPEPAKQPQEIKQLRDGIIRQYVQDCQKEQKVLVWNDCCERLAKEEIKLTPERVCHIYHYEIKHRNPDRKITKYESNKFNAEFDDWVMGEVKQYGLSWTTIASHQNEYSAEEIRRRYSYRNR